MPTQQEVRWSQLKVGVLVLVAAVILVTLLFLITSSSGLGVFSKKLTITTYFENSAGLKEGGAVTLEGVTVGSVKSVTVSHEPCAQADAGAGSDEDRFQVRLRPENGLEGGVEDERCAGRYAGGHQ